MADDTPKTAAKVPTQPAASTAPAVPPPLPFRPGDKTLNEIRTEQAAEYGKYTALGPIDHDGVRAYNAGDPVPVANVEAHGYLDQSLVAESDSAEAKTARGIEV